MYQYPYYLMHYGVKGMKWGVRRRKKIRERASNHLMGLNARARQLQKIDQQALDSGSPDWIKNSVHPKYSKDLNMAKKALRSDLSSQINLGKRTLAANKELMALPIENVSTRKYKKQVNMILDSY